MLEHGEMTCLRQRSWHMKLHTEDDKEKACRSLVRCSRPTFAVVSLSDETPEHFETVMAVGRFVKRLLGEEMSVVLVGLLSRG